MSPQRNALRAGIVMIASLAMVVFVILSIGGASRFTQSFSTYRVAFNLSDDVGGLRAGDDVRIGGLKVGNVSDMSIDAQASKVLVFIQLPSKYPLGKDSIISVEKALTGTAAINIDSLGTSPQASANDEITGHPDRLSLLFRNLTQMAPEAQATLANLRVASGKLNVDLDKFGNVADSFTTTGFSATQAILYVRLRLPQIIEKYQRVTDSAMAALDSVHEFLGPSSGDFHGTVHNLKVASGDVKDRVPEVLDQIRGILTKTDTVIGRAADAMIDIRASVSNIKTITTSARRVILNNKSKIDEMISYLKDTAENLDYASIEIRHSPWRLLYQPKPDEVANINTYDSVRRFAEGASDLNDIAHALDDAVKDKDVDPAQIKALQDRLDGAFDKFRGVEDQLWKNIKE